MEMLSRCLFKSNGVRILAKAKCNFICNSEKCTITAPTLPLYVNKSEFKSGVDCMYDCSNLPSEGRRPNGVCRYAIIDINNIFWAANIRGTYPVLPAYVDDLNESVGLVL